MRNERSNQTEAVLWTGIVTDFALAVFKGIAGYLLNSKALMADAMYSSASAASLLADRLPHLRVFGRSSAERNKQGPSMQSESVISILIAVLIMMGGLQIGVSAIQTFAAGVPEAPDKTALLAVLISLAINEAVFQYQYHHMKKNRDHRLQSILENHRFALYCSITVIIGVFLSFISGVYFDGYGLMYMDSVAALIVACLVIRKGYISIIHSVYGTLTEEKRHEFEPEFMDTIQRVHGVITVEKLKVQEYGQVRQVNLEVMVSVNPRTSVLEAQEIAERIRKLLTHRFMLVSDVKVSVVPYDPGYPYKSNFDLMDNDSPTLPQ